MAVVMPAAVDDTSVPAGQNGTILTAALWAAVGTAVDAEITARLVTAGTWTTPAYAAGNFTGSGSMTWTVESGDVGTYAWVKIGKKMTISFVLSNTVVGGTPSSGLNIAIPGSFIAAKTMIVPFQYSDAGTLGVGQIQVDGPTGTILRLLKTTFANWTAGTAHVQGQITIETTT